MNVILAPSLLSADFANLGKVCEDLLKAGIKWLHLDVMDGRFVPNITFGFCVIQALRKISPLFFDVHLMIEQPERYIAQFADAGSDLVVIHLETAIHPQQALQNIRQKGKYAGLALNPGTDFTQIRWLLPYIDLIVVMGVNPGFSGQKFIPETLAKLRELRRFLDDLGYGHIPLEIDGGASAANAKELVEAGASILVSGSAFFAEKDFDVSVKKFAGALLDRENSAPGSALANALSWKHC